MELPEVISKDKKVRGQIEFVQQEFNAELSAFFDASEGGYIGKGWPTTYIMLGLSVALPKESCTIPDKTFKEIISLFQKIHERMHREKSFYCLEFKTTTPGKPYSITNFFENSHLFDEIPTLLLKVSELLIRLSQSNAGFNMMYEDERFALSRFSSRNKRILTLDLKDAPEFNTHFVIQNTKIYTDEYPDAWLGDASMFLGNAYFLDGAYEKAIDHWSFCSKYDVSGTAFYNMACAHSNLGDMESAYHSCIKAVEQNVDRNLLLHDEDLSLFRKHPLYKKVLEMLK